MVANKKRISTTDLIKRMTSLRKKPLSPGFDDKFNQIIEEDDRHDRRSTQRPRKKIARSPEVEG